MRKWAGVTATMIATAAVATGLSAHAEATETVTLETRLRGFEEVPAVSTRGTGTFVAELGPDSLVYELSYADLEGQVQQAHIHFGQARVNGGISVFLCTNLGNGPEGTQECPNPPATVTGEIVPDDVIGPEGQGITEGEFDELAAAIRRGVAYVNVHSDLHPGGEIRGQLGDDLAVLTRLLEEFFEQRLQ